MSNKKLRKEIEQLNAENERLRRMAREGSKKTVKSGNAKRQRKIKAKKKRGCLGGCLNAIKNLIVFCLVVTVIIGVGGYFAGDYYAKQYLNMSANEILSVVGGLTKSDENKLVTEDDRYTDTDLNNFYANLKDQLFLSSTFDLKGTLEEIAADALNGDGGSGVFTASETTESGDALDRLLKAENFNLARIEEFDYDNADEFMRYALTDRQLAAFLNSIINSDFVNEMVDEQVKSGLGFSVPVNLSVKKIRFFTQVDQFNVYNSNGELVGTDSGEVQKLQVSVGFALRDTLGAFITHYTGQYGDFKFLAKLFMKDIFLTVEVALTHDSAPRVYINNMDAKGMADLYKLVREVTGLLGQQLDIEKMLIDIGRDTLYPVLDSVNDTIPFNEITNRTLQFSPFDLLVGVLAKDFEGETPEGKDLFLLLQVLLESDWADIVYQPFRQVGYKPSSNPDAPDNGWEAVVLLTEEDMEKAVEDNLITKDENGDYVFADHIELFKEVLEDRYYIKIEDFDELIKLITGSEIGGDGGTTPLAETDGSESSDDDSLSVLLDKFEKDKFRQDYNDENAPDDVINQPIFITDFILAGIMDEAFKRFDTDTEGEDEGGFSFDLSIITLEQLIIFNQEASENLIERDFMLMTISLTVDELIKDAMGESRYANFVSDLIADGQLPNQLFATLTVDITDTENRVNPYIQLNEMGNDYKTDKVWNLLEVLAGIKMDDVASQVGDYVTPMIDEMREMMPIEFKHNLTEQELNSGAIQLPGIMSFIIELMQLEIKDETSGEMRLIEAGELRRILMTLDRGSMIDDDDTVGGIKDTYLDNLPKTDDSLNKFFMLLEEKYYLKVGTLSFVDSIEAALEWYCKEELGLTDEGDIANKVNELLADESVDKAVIKQDYIDAMCARILEMNTLFDNIGDSFRLWQETEQGTPIGYMGLLDDRSNIEDMEVFLTDRQMVELIKTQIDAETLKGTEILQITVSFDGTNYVLEMTVKAQLSEVFGEGMDFSKFLPENALSVAYIRAFVTIADGKTSPDGNPWYETEIVLNDVGDSDMSLLMNFIDSYTDGDVLGDFKLMLGESIYDAFASLQDTLGFEFSLDGNNNGGLKFRHFYDVLSEILGMEEAGFYFNTTDELNAADDAIKAKDQIYEKYENIWAMFVTENMGIIDNLENTQGSFETHYEVFREYMTLHFYDVMRLSLQGMHVSNDFVNELVVSEIADDDKKGIDDFLGDPQPISGAYFGDGTNIDIDVTLSLTPKFNSVSISDYAFARFVANDMNAMTKEEEQISSQMTIEIEQIMVLANTELANNFAVTDQTSKIDNYMFNFYNDYIVGRTDSGVMGTGGEYENKHTYLDSEYNAFDFLVFTIKATFDGIEFDGAEDILPEYIYISLIRNNSTGAYMVVINGYTVEEQKMFFDLIVTASGDDEFTESKLLGIMGDDVIGKYIGNAQFERNENWGGSGVDSEIMGRIVYNDVNDLSPDLKKALKLENFPSNP